MDGTTLKGRPPRPGRCSTERLEMPLSLLRMWKSARVPVQSFQHSTFYLCPSNGDVGRQNFPTLRVPRTGWVYRNVERPESVSDHMYRMAVMALLTKDDHLNKDRCVRLALVHDMAECIVGDIAPADNIPKEEKHRREEEAMKQLTQLLSKDLGKELYELWEEYETQSSPEAKFVKQLDQCEMILQASEYEDLENKPGRLQDFYDSTADLQTFVRRTFITRLAEVELK
ncbi:PREDICTED: HD domain-containing protein 2 isoform X2 [Hipposideros armiger]|uniref:5'-deoxynucleotidase HDDC2 n=1 Tax=Hipposideros armiger TaxID=186990 RepID=A0A8B7SZM8_HIPAR|nr:PREDICTED: HD domain-containing protein 2 isoform X2 [Hipposideros armiger]